MSTDAQLKGHSLERQLQLTKDYARDNNLSLVEDIRDIGVSAHSGANVNRGKLGEFFKAIKNGEIEQDCILLVESLDRLSRQNPMSAFTQFSEILEYGIEIHTIFDKQIYTKESLINNPGLLFTSIGYMLRAFSESEEKSKRLKKRWQDKRDNIDKKLLTSRCPAWLEANSNKTAFDLIPERETTIETIFDLYIDQDMGAYSIVKHLNQNLDKYPTFSKGSSGWQKSYILKILNNTSVHGMFNPHIMIDGKRTPSDTLLENYFPAVISENRFLLAQAKMKQRTIAGGGRKGSHFNNIFTKMLFCGHCDSTLNFLNKGKPPKGGKYLRCGKAEYQHSCRAPAWRYEEFTDSFFNFVSEPEFEQLIKKGDYQSRKSKLLDDTDITKEKIGLLDLKFNSINNILINVKDSTKPRLMKKLDDISSELYLHEDKLKSIKEELAIVESLNSKQTHREVVDALKQTEGELNNDEKTERRRRTHAILKKVIDKITIHNFTPVFDAPSGTENNVSPLVMRFLAKQGIEDEEEIIKMFSGSSGNHAFQKAERYYVVHFNNGQKRTVQPFIENTWKIDESRWMEFKDKVEENKKAKATAKRTHELKYKRRSKNK